MARASTTKAVPPEQPLVEQEIKQAFQQSMAEVTMAKRLYEVWRTGGQLHDMKWDWNRQSDQAHRAWIAVARAASPLVLLQHFGPEQVAEVLHA